MTKCLICDHKPRMAESKYCHNCAAKLAAERAKTRKPAADKYLHFRGQFVGFYCKPEPTEDGHGLYKPVYLGYFPWRGKLNRHGKPAKPRFPLSKTIDLDTYVPGFSRDQVKHFKRLILKLSGAKSHKRQPRQEAAA